MAARSMQVWSMAAVFAANLAAVTAQAGECGKVSLAVGSYTGVTWIKDPPASGEGVTYLDLELCKAGGGIAATLTNNGVTAAGENPSYCDQLDATSIVCANEIDAGTATVLGAEPGTAAETIDLGVNKPTHINVLKDGVVATANFGGSFSTFKPGGADPVIEVVEAPGAAPHPHMILETGGAEIVVPVLGTDVVYQYDVAMDGTLTMTGTTTVEAGSGPRHVALGPEGKVYVAAEASLQIIELGKDCAEGAEGAARGVCGFVQLPPAVNGTTFWTGAAIRVSKDGGFVYMSLREDGDGPWGAIAGVKLGPDGALGDLIDIWQSGGNTPRDFVLVDIPGFKEVFVVANRKGNEVSVLDRDEVTGAVGAELATAEVQTPTNILVLAGATGVAAANATAPAAAPAAAEGPAVAPLPAPTATPLAPAAGTDVQVESGTTPNQSGARGVDSGALSVEPSSATLSAAAKCLAVFAAAAVFIAL